MSDSPGLTIAVAEMRSTFDRVYAVPPSSNGAEHSENLLAIRLAGDPYAIRASEISGVARVKKVVSLPSLIPELLGLAGLRGEVIPVYNLAAFLGYTEETKQVRWLALHRAEEPFGVAFGDFDDYVKVSSRELITAGQRQTIREHVHGVVHVAGHVRAIINLSSIGETIKRRCGDSRVDRER